MADRSSPDTLLIRDIVQAAIELACIRHDLCFYDEPPLVVEQCAEIVTDVFNALRGIDTCDPEPCPEFSAILAALEDRQEAPKWQRLPDEQAWWWHWNGEDLSVPHIYCVMVSKTGRDRYFIAHPDSRWCDEMGGAWLKLERPNVPERDLFRPAVSEDRQEAAPRKDTTKSICGCIMCEFHVSAAEIRDRVPGVPSEAAKEEL